MVVIDEKGEIVAAGSLEPVPLGEEPPSEGKAHEHVLHREPPVFRPVVDDGHKMVEIEVSEEDAGLPADQLLEILSRQVRSDGQADSGRRG